MSNNPESLAKALADVLNELDRDTGTYFGKIVDIPFDKIEEITNKTREKVGDEALIAQFSKEKVDRLNERMQLLACVKRFHDDLIANYPAAKSCHERAKQHMELVDRALDAVGRLGATIN